jgi:ketosteroid isomerase-like protein
MANHPKTQTNLDGAEADVAALITRWVDAVASRDLDGVLAHHSEGIVMFDVPPPHSGVRGMAEYRDSWGPFFEWQRDTDGIFELVELHVEADSELAFAYALLRCGTAVDLDANPSNRLRVTVGLRNIDGQWTVVHEHHSFPLS